MAASDEVLAREAALLADTRAFEELVRRHQRRVLLLQRSLARDHALAEDLCQETFLRAWRKLATFSGRGSFGGWLAHLGYNVFLAHRRRTRRQDAEQALDGYEPVATPDPSAAVELERLLAMLPEEDRLLLVMNYAFGLSNTEIGERLELPVGTIKSRIFRARQTLAARIAAGERKARRPLQGGGVLP